jgi:hypothetical protein
MCTTLCRSLCFVCCLIVAVQLAACKSTTKKTDSAGSENAARVDSSSPGREHAMEAHVAGRGVFIENGAKHYASFWVKGAHSRNWPNPNQVSLLHIDVYGAPGMLGADELGLPAYFLLTVPLTPNQRAWSLGPRDWPHDKTPWEKDKPYSLLFRHVFQVNDGSGNAQYITDVSKFFPFPSAAVTVNGIFPPEPSASGQPGDTITSVISTGTFMLGPPVAQALYDVSLTYSPPGTARVEIFAGPASGGNPPMDLIPPVTYPASTSTPYFITSEEITDSVATAWTGTGMPGSYDGSATYCLGVRLTTSDGVVSRRIATYKNIQPQQPQQPMQP